MALIKCPECSKEISDAAKACPSCGHPLISSSAPTGSEKNRIVACVLAIFLGGLGVHKFYLGKIGIGIIYLLLSWTFIPSIVGLIEGIIYLTMSDATFAAKYGGTALSVQPQAVKKGLPLVDNLAKILQPKGTQGSPNTGDSKDGSLPKGNAVGALVGSIILGISVPMKWEEIYAGTEVSIGTSGYIILIEVVLLVLCALGQIAAKNREEALNLAKPIEGLAGFAFLYAAYTILGNWSVGETNIGGITGGIANGPGVWIGLIGALVVLISQAPLLVPTQVSPSGSKDDSVKKDGQPS